MKNTKLKTRTEKGITLIALIITIVVLMILAAVAINSITNDGIIEKTGSTANTYNQAVKNEQGILNEYEIFLENGGKFYDEYKTGDTVTIGTEDFYVIKDSTKTEETVLLLSKGNINTTTLLQDGNDNYVKFCESVYWTVDGDINETLPIPESHIAAKAAYDYGVKVGGKGRLMLKSEASDLWKTDFKSKLCETYFWLGTNNLNIDYAYVYYIEAEPGYEIDWDNYDWSYGVGVRPVVEISKSKVTAVTVTE